MTIKEVEQEIVDEFSIFTEWMDKYEYLIELGKSLPIIGDSAKQESNLIKGCQSRVWLNAQISDGKLYFTADSDAIITKGIISLLVRVYSGRTPKEILEADIEFIEKIGLQDNLSPTRANGLLSMIRQIKYYAAAYS
ncbi:MAG: Fe-S metabolism protein SufE [Bacteroidetes bacterium GWF2_41_61]|jgi:cysteine desulfuration protein SufE|nr:MAG: Fe-S metabolism protein SufE [Bacteroidetes bacterium GWE2_40_15]OFY29982.1 MAG: Fe-S metabolism protein SufE [Bacteroidetes bacterium GWF2_41_61]OFY90633.1 MAG: Fe-S metabolism protein SufE [Bacteroidetes bacterium RIFOXYA12_FULL_40_10]PKP07255.1 MAG: Fe-S metabolism protein SufE [Bacteroidetes bacterium HGW-Bacteroidetes-5]HBG24936.1 Fe-S metabolism protein SufE [Rikenellaceae bacterium]